MAVSIKTGRGKYWLKTGARDQRDADSITLTLALERADGIERVAFKCRIASALLNAGTDTESILMRLAPWTTQGSALSRIASGALFLCPEASK